MKYQITQILRSVFIKPKGILVKQMILDRHVFFRFRQPVLFGLIDTFKPFAVYLVQVAHLCSS